jgi:uncharacterized protein (DUF1697 family)
MTTFVVLLRGVNVGGSNRLPMADLRTALEQAGLAHVRTYIQSGNVVLDAPARDPEAVAAHVRAVVARTFGLDVPCVALSAAQLDGVVAANPFPDEADPRRLHAIVLPAPPTEAMLHALAHRAAALSDGTDEVTVVGRVAYLHTPAGFGTSRLAAALTSGARSNPLADGTARNWATVAALQDMCSH